MTRAAEPLFVALVTDSIYPYYRGGKEIRYHELARRLADRADVTIYTMHWWDGPRRLDDGPVRFRALCGLKELYRNGRRSLGQSVIFAASAFGLLFRRFDVIEADTVSYPQIFTLKLVALIRRRRLVITWHEVWDLPQWRAQLGRLGLLGAALGRLAMLLPDEIVAVSPRTAAQLRSRTRRSTGIHLAPGGIDLDALRAAPPAPTGVDVLCVGRLIEHKGVGMLLEALALLRAQGTELTALIVGRGPLAADLRAECRRLGLDDLVEFRDDIETNDEVYGLMKTARVFASPSTREGFGVAVLEALACGVPVVTTSHPENLSRLLVVDGGAGQLCEPEPAALAAAILRAIADDDRAADEWLRGYDWDAVTDRTMEAYTR